MYLASTGALFAVAIVDPLAGLVGFVGSHAIEYFVIVNRSVVSEASHSGPLGEVSRLRHGPTMFLVFYLAAATGLFLVLYDLAPTQVLLLVSVLTIGALHFFYDSFIWKLRKPAVAASLAAPGRGRAPAHAGTLGHRPSTTTLSAGDPWSRSRRAVRRRTRSAAGGSRVSGCRAAEGELRARPGDGLPGRRRLLQEDGRREAGSEWRCPNATEATSAERSTASS